jgi:hypothetical protein
MHVIYDLMLFICYLDLTGIDNVVCEDQKQCV